MAKHPFTHTDFNGNPPGPALDDPSRATSNFRGSLYLVGGSMQEDGKSPYDINPNNVKGDPANASTVWGINAFQGQHLGQDII